MSPSNVNEDYRNTERYRKKLSYGVINTKSAKNVVYELPEYLPPITDFVYNVEKDIWERRKNIEKESEEECYKVIIPDTSLLVNKATWSNYNESKERTDIPYYTVRDGFVIDVEEDDYRLLVVPLEKDTTEYISAIYDQNILGMVLSYCIETRKQYMRLRIVCKRFKYIIDTNSQMVDAIAAMIYSEALNPQRFGCIFKYPPVLAEAALRSINNISHCDYHENCANRNVTSIKQRNR